MSSARVVYDRLDEFPWALAVCLHRGLGNPPPPTPPTHAHTHAQVRVLPHVGGGIHSVSCREHHIANHLVFRNVKMCVLGCAHINVAMGLGRGAVGEDGDTEEWEKAEEVGAVEVEDKGQHHIT